MDEKRIKQINHGGPGSDWVSLSVVSGNSKCNATVERKEDGSFCYHGPFPPCSAHGPQEHTELISEAKNILRGRHEEKARKILGLDDPSQDPAEILGG